MQNVCRRSRRRGVSLIEVLVAALILAVSLAGLLNVFMFSAAMTRSTDEKAVACGIGRSCLETVRAGGSHYWHPTMVATGYTVQTFGNTGALYERQYDGDGTPVNSGGVLRVVCEVRHATVVSPLPEQVWRDMVTIEVQRVSDNAVLFTSRSYLVIGGI